ncbi:MAG: hypothetical protein WCT85_00755 [Parachlamydiales bacterium]
MKPIVSKKSGIGGFDTKQIIVLIVIVVVASFITSYIQRKIAERKQASEPATE